MDTQTLTPEARAAALERFERHTHVALRIARKLAFGAFRADEMDDVQQEALLALWRAALAYDESKSNGAAFSTFAHKHCWGACMRWLRDRAWVVRPPRRVYDAQGRSVRDVKSGEIWSYLAPFIARDYSESYAVTNTGADPDAETGGDGTPDPSAETSMGMVELRHMLRRASAVMTSDERMAVFLAAVGFDAWDIRQRGLATARKSARPKLRAAGIGAGP